MPLYFFNVHHDGRVTNDPEGEELPDLVAARVEAVSAVRDIAAELVGNGDLLDMSGRIEITDEGGETLLNVPFRDALAIKP
jgi:hypothetical protein